MEVLIWELKLAMVVLSLLGYVFFVSRMNRKLEFEFIPVIVMSILANILLLAGYVDLLKIVSWIIFVSGILLLGIGVCCWRDEIRNNKSIIYLLILVFIFSFIVYGKKFIRPDDYSHWAIVIKRILSTDSLPAWPDKTIQYQSYPTGMACINYYFCLLMNDSNDWTMCLGQGIVMLCCVYSALAISKRKYWWHFLILTVIGYGLIWHVNGPVSVYVDTVLPLLAGSAFIMFHKYRDDLLGVLPYISSIMCLCMMTKNSGIFFVIFMIVTILIFGKRKAIPTLIIATTVGISKILWDIHVKVAFPEGLQSNHAMSLSHYITVFQGREPAIVWKTIRSFIFEGLLSFESIWKIGYLLLFYCLTICMLKNYGKETQKYKYHFITIILAYGLYAVGLLGMYLFSLEDGSPQDLPQFYRYMATIDLFNCMLLLEMLMELLDKVHMQRDKKSGKWEIDRKSLIGLLLVLGYLPILITRVDYTTSISFREEIEKIKYEYDIEDGKNYLIYVDYYYDPYAIGRDKEIKKYDAYKTQYVLNSSDFIFADKATIEESCEEFEYTIFMVENEFTENYNVLHGNESNCRVIHNKE